MNFARALTSPKVCAGGQVLEDEEWYVLDAEWGRACAPAVFAMQATAARINCCLYAADAADAEPKMLFEYLFEYLFADWAGLTAVEIATRCGPWPSSRRASASPWCCSTTSQLDHNYLRRLLCVAAPGESVTVTETDVSKFIAYPRVFLYFTKVL